MNCPFKRDYNEQMENVQLNSNINKRQAGYANEF